jgi:hypothetical protein
VLLVALSATFLDASLLSDSTGKGPVAELSAFFLSFFDGISAAVAYFSARIDFKLQLQRQAAARSCSVT